LGEGDSTVCFSVVLSVCVRQWEVEGHIRRHGIPTCCSRRAETDSWFTYLIIHGLFSGARIAQWV